MGRTGQTSDKPKRRFNKDKDPEKKKKKKKNDAKTKDNVGTVIKKRPHRFKPGTRSLMEIRKYQKTYDLLIQKAPFRRFVKNILLELCDEEKRISKDGLALLQHSFEASVTQFLNSAVHCTIHGKRVTTNAKDVRLTAMFGKLDIPEPL